jgi:uncharacterized protein (TIGR02680 family)
MSGADRWRPVRAGIVNLYEYGDQVFELSGGRLLLRGHNTSGKTKALELLLPFCLDGDISPRKLDPFARNAKEMHWNLVECGAHDQRTGYVWLEFERLAADAGPARLTVGIGMKANRASRDVRRWYFVARDRKVGADLRLVREDREPVSRVELAAAIGDDGELVDTQAEYRRRLNDLLFGFPSEDGYRAMLRLMLELRRPHLSKNLNPDAVAELLSAGLPSVDEALMRRLAGGLEQLDSLEQGLARLRSTSEGLRAFHERTYRGYLRAVMRERGERLRRSHTRFDAAAEAVRAARGALADAERETERLRAEREAAERGIVRLEGEMQAIVSSAEWGSIAEVQALGERAAAQARTADARRESAEEAAGTAAALEAERITSEAAAAEDMTAAGAGLDELCSLAEHAGLAARAEALAAQLREESIAAETWVGLARDLARDWLAVLAAHAEHLDRCRQATEAAGAAREAERRAADRLAAARATVAESDAQVDAARKTFDAALAAWQSALRELEPDSDLLGSMRRRAHRGEDPRSLLADPADAARAAISAERGMVAAALRGLEDELADLDAGIEAVEAEHDDGPPPPTLERTGREGRAGAPLWRLVDFAADLTAAHRAAIEAALEAGGLLDAWVLPDGGVLDAGVLDASLLAGAHAVGPTLANALVAVDGPVPAAVVEGLLARVALRDAAEPDLPAVVGRDGSYGLGPLRGRTAKPAAEHVGPAAREARRVRLRAELAARRDQACERTAALRESDERLAERRAALDTELASTPSRDPTAAALHGRHIAQAIESRAAAEHEQASADARAAGDAEVAADAERRRRAVAHDLDPAVDAAGLRARSEAAAQLAGAVAGVGAAWRMARRSAERERTLAEHTRRAAALAEERATVARREAAEAERLAAEHAAREAALGQTGAELRARYEQVTGALRAARADRSCLDETERAADRQAEGLRRDVLDGNRAQQEARDARELATARFASLGAAGVLDLALGDTAPEDAAVATAWPLTRVLEVARAVAREVRGASSAPGELGQEVMRRVQLLDRELAEAELGAYATHADEDLVVVRITDDAGDRGLGDVLESLAADIAERERLLTAEERRVFGDALVQEIADHLRSRIRAVRERVAAMNRVLAQSPTAAGKVVQLEWRTLDDDTGTQRSTVELLRKSASYHGEDERSRIVEFFRARVEQARSELGGAEAALSMTDTLTRAFDYRRWFAFGLVEEAGGSRERLTARRHAVGSGGEQSVLIHLPLLAAAAALFGDSAAPRLVMLDEALSGVDDETRERVLAATVAFDLDIVMTSHELWGTYRSVPSLSIYQLHREQGVPGVHAVPFRWDGEVLHELEQADLRM